jgi:hypothetical protein
MKRHEFNVIFGKFHTSYSNSSFVLDKILIHEDEHENEDEYEKYQIRSNAYALKPKAGKKVPQGDKFYQPLKVNFSTFCPLPLINGLSHIMLL